MRLRVGHGEVVDSTSPVKGPRNNVHVVLGVRFQVPNDGPYSGASVGNEADLFGVCVLEECYRAPGTVVTALVCVSRYRHHVHAVLYGLIVVIKWQRCC